MFSADLSWTGPDTEKVGERRERKARERSSTIGSIRTSTSSRSSVSADRELWWTSGFKKAKGLKPNILRPKSQRDVSSQSSQKIPHPSPRNLDISIPEDLKDPTLQPSWTYASTLSPTLPSGAPFDLPGQEVPELEGDTSSRRTTSTEARISNERRYEVRTPIRVDIIEETCEQQPKSPESVTGRTRASSVATHREQVASSWCADTTNQAEKRRCPVISEGVLSFEALQLHDAIQHADSDEKSPRHAPEVNISHTRKVECPPLSQWQCLKARGVPPNLHFTQRAIVDSVAVAHSSTIELTRFQRFIRRMENAGPKIVLDRLKEDWEDLPISGLNDELALEKELWLLTGLQMQNLGGMREAPKPKCDTGRILELYGNLSEVFQSSAMYPQHTVHFLTTKPQRPITLPANVSYLTVRESGAVPLPYPEGFFTHMRASTLPSLVPSSSLPELFRECYKLLAPGGLLEIRIMDAAPVRKSAGPLLRTWIDERLSVNLERLFRCSKPCSLVPAWLQDAGFDLIEPEKGTKATLPCAFDEASSDVNEELATEIGRALWKDVWGDFVDDAEDEPKWWWEDADIIEECLRRHSVLECRTIFAHRK